MRMSLLATIAMIGVTISAAGLTAEVQNCETRPAAGMHRVPSETADQLAGSGQPTADTGRPSPLAQSGQPIPDYPIPPTVDVAAESCAER